MTKTLERRITDLESDTGSHRFPPFDPEHFAKMLDDWPEEYIVSEKDYATISDSQIVVEFKSACKSLAKRCRNGEFTTLREALQPLPIECLGWLADHGEEYYEGVARNAGKTATKSG